MNANMGYDVYVSTKSDDITRYIHNVETEICRDQDPHIPSSQCHTRMPTYERTYEEGHVVARSIPYQLWKKQIRNGEIYVMTYMHDDESVEVACVSDDISELCNVACTYEQSYMDDTHVVKEIHHWIKGGKPQLTLANYSPTYGVLTITRKAL